VARVFVMKKVGGQIAEVETPAASHVSKTARRGAILDLRLSSDNVLASCGKRPYGPRVQVVLPIAAIVTGPGDSPLRSLHDFRNFLDNVR